MTEILGFYSYDIINGSHRLHVLLRLLYNIMLLHGYTPTDLLKSSIISIPKDVHVSLSNIDNYRGIALFNQLFGNTHTKCCGHMNVNF